MPITTRVALITKPSQDTYDQALHAVQTMADTSRMLVSDDRTDEQQTTVQDPIYQQLVSELQSRLLAIGEQYDLTADAAAVPPEQRFDWRAVTASSEA